MDAADKFALLQAEGDPLERVITCFADLLAPVIYTYANVWADIVRPQRQGDGSVVQESWMPFAGSHYTALIRLYHALQSKLAIEAVSQQFEDGDLRAELLLDAHAHTAAFWENLGSCIDNLALALEDARCALNEGENREAKVDFVEEDEGDGREHSEEVPEDAVSDSWRSL